jgi:hypothetical protein
MAAVLRKPVVGRRLEQLAVADALPRDSLACLTRRFVVFVGRPVLPCLAGSRTAS